MNGPEAKTDLRDVSVDIWPPVVLTGGATLIAGLVTFLVARR